MCHGVLRLVLDFEAFDLLTFSSDEAANSGIRYNPLWCARRSFHEETNQAFVSSDCMTVMYENFMRSIV